MMMDDGPSAVADFSKASHDWSVMSSMMGPSFESDLNPLLIPAQLHPQL